MRPLWGGCSEQALVQLLDRDAFGRSLEAQLAQRALVDVVFDDFDCAFFGAELEDVDRADLDQLFGEARALLDHGVFDFDADEHCHDQPPALAMRSFTRRGMSPISSATVMPASRMRRILSAGES